MQRQVVPYHNNEKTQPLGSFLSFLEATIAFEGMGRPRGFRRFRKTHLENILPRGSRDRDPRYPKGVPWDQNFFLKNFLLKSYLGICRQVWGLLWVKSKANILLKFFYMVATRKLAVMGPLT